MTRLVREDVLDFLIEYVWIFKLPPIQIFGRDQTDCSELTGQGWSTAQVLPSFKVIIYTTNNDMKLYLIVYFKVEASFV